MIGPDARIAAWAAAALPVARAILADSTEAWRCGGTWFVGVDALPNPASGTIADAAFPWDALPLAPGPLHRAQLSVIRPGYPQPAPGETASANAFRLRRDAAHLDGVLPVGPARRRMIREPHGWILGLPLTACGPGASPLVVWEASHEVLRRALLAALHRFEPADWPEIDVTDACQTARAEVFRTCRRVEVRVRPGEATLLHRLTLHGTAPWLPGAMAPQEGRIIAYLRPELPSVHAWLALP